VVLDFIVIDKMEIKGAAEQMNHEERPENAKHFFPKWTPYVFMHAMFGPCSIIRYFNYS